MSSGDSLIDRLSGYQGAAESTSESITCTIGVDNLVIGDGVDFVDDVFLLALCNDGIVRSLSNDNYTGLGGVLLW